MKILLFGNIGSGKTTLAKRLIETRPFELTAIDDFRRTHGDGTSEGELSARKHFFDSITEEKNQLIECTGVGKVAEGLFEIISQMAGPVIVLTLLVPQAVCKLRIAQRIWDIPFPHPLEKVDDLIDRTETRIQEGAIASLWNKCANSLQLYRENNNEKDLAHIAAELTALAKQPDQPSEALTTKQDTGIDQMLNRDVQAYYSQAYTSYQKGVIEKNPLFLEDRTMISDFIEHTAISGTLADIGAGNCQWFSLLENKVSHYYALETNQDALDMAPQNSKLVPIRQNIFDPRFDLLAVTGQPIGTALLSFFLSHFSDQAIAQLFQKLSTVPDILIIDSFWSPGHRKKYLSKELRTVRRKTAPDTAINLPKRFFEIDDIRRLAGPLGYHIIRFEQGYYWFACQLKKQTEH